MNTLTTFYLSTILYKKKETVMTTGINLNLDEVITKPSMGLILFIINMCRSGPVTTHVWAIAGTGMLQWVLGVGTTLSIFDVYILYYILYHSTNRSRGLLKKSYKLTNQIAAFTI